MRTYCLCLPERPERIKRASQHFAEVGLEDVRFFHGINSDLAGLSTSHLYELDNPGYRMGPKPIGIWLSHYMLWSHLAHAYDADDCVMILEDDAKFPLNWATELEEAFSYIPDFDFLFAGHCCLAGTAMEHLGGKVYSTKSAQCNHCYIVRCGVLRKVLMLLRRVWAPIDIQLMLEVLPLVASYAIVPRLVEQFDTFIPP